jgi:hypothetical protein
VSKSRTNFSCLGSFKVNLKNKIYLFVNSTTQIFYKIRNRHIGILGSLGKLIHEKTWSRKSRDTVPLSLGTYVH